MSEANGEITACVGYWDFSRVVRVTVEALSRRLRATRVMLKVMRHIRRMPRLPKAGTTIKEWCLTPIGFRDVEHLTSLLRHINNLGLRGGIDQISCICERDSALLRAMKGMFHVDIGLDMYVKPLQRVGVGDKPVFVDGIDL